MTGYIDWYNRQKKNPHTFKNVNYKWQYFKSSGISSIDCYWSTCFMIIQTITSFFSILLITGRKQQLKMIITSKEAIQWPNCYKIITITFNSPLNCFNINAIHGLYYLCNSNFSISCPMLTHFYKHRCTK